MDPKFVLIQVPTLCFWSPCCNMWNSPRDGPVVCSKVTHFTGLHTLDFINYSWAIVCIVFVGLETVYYGLSRYLPIFSLLKFCNICQRPHEIFLINNIIHCIRVRCFLYTLLTLCKIWLIITREVFEYFCVFVFRAR